MKKELTTFFLLFAIMRLWAYDYTENNVNYTISDGEVIIVTSPNATGDLVIPHEIVINNHTYTVKEIQSSAFTGCSGLKSVTIENDGVRTIGSTAFSGCRFLKSVTIPNSVNNIGFSCFAYCTSLESIVVDEGNQWYDSRNNCNAVIQKEDNSLWIGCKNSVIPNEVTAIVSGAFQGCTGLTSVTVFSSNLKSIGSSAFANCDGLTSITIPSTVTSIGQDAFNGCDGLQSVTYEANVAIPEGLFRNCSALSEVNINPSSPVSIGKWAFRGCESLEEIDLRNANSVGEEAFLACTGLETITMDYFSTGMPIGKRAFFGCSALTDVSDHFIANEIGDSAFVDCVSLDTLVFDNPVSRIGHHAFQGCTELKTAGGPYIETIGDEAFDGCSKLKYFCFSNASKIPTKGNDIFKGTPETLRILFMYQEYFEYWYSQFEEAWSDLGKTILPFRDISLDVNIYGKAISMPSETEYDIRCHITSTWPDEMEVELGGPLPPGAGEPLENPENPDEPFMYDPNDMARCISFDVPGTLIIPATIEGYKVTAVADHAFNLCDRLEGIVLPGTVKEIYTGAFYGNHSLRHITLPSSLEYIEAPFEYCGALSYIDMSEATSFSDIVATPEESSNVFNTYFIPSWDPYQTKVLVYLPTTNSPTGITNAIYYENDEWKCSHLNLCDIYPQSDDSWQGFIVPRAFKTSHISYNRSFITGIKQTVCLPFGIKNANRFGKFYAFKEYNQTTGEVVFTQVSQTSAYVPYLFEPTVQTISIEDEETEVLASPNFEEVVGFNGVWEKRYWEDANSDNIYGYYQGEFVKAGTWVTVAPFRAYLKLEGNAQSTRMSVKFEDVEQTGIVNIGNDSANKERMFTLAGQLIDNNSALNGIYIQGGKKRIIRK